jgi:hypothetical protein
VPAPVQVAQQVNTLRATGGALANEVSTLQWQNGDPAALRARGRGPGLRHARLARTPPAPPPRLDAYAQSLRDRAKAPPPIGRTPSAPDRPNSRQTQVSLARTLESGDHRSSRRHAMADTAPFDTRRPRLAAPGDTTEIPFSSLAADAVRVTEAAAVASFAQIGRGDEMQADQLAVDAMRTA